MIDKIEEQKKNGWKDGKISGTLSEVRIWYGNLIIININCFICVFMLYFINLKKKKCLFLIKL